MKIPSCKIVSVLLAILLFFPVLAVCSSGATAEAVPAGSEPDGAGTVTVAGGESGADREALQALASAYAGKTVGVQLGTVFDTVINHYIPEAKVEYYQSNADMALALKAGKISAYAADEPMARLLCQTYPDQYITGAFETCLYAYMFPKDMGKTAVIRPQMNEFLARIKADGTVQEIDEVWFGSDESKKVVDTSDLTGENGTLEFVMCSAVGAPFAYVKDNACVGYDVDIAVRFCREYGYGIHITDNNVGGLFASIATGLADFGASSVAITEERKEEMDFSDPNYEGSLVLVTRDFEETDVIEVSDPTRFAVLNGKNVGVIKDSVGVGILEQLIPGANIVEMGTLNELLAALEADRIDAYFEDQPLVRHALPEYPNHHVLGVVGKADYAFLFQKDDQRSDKLRNEMNEFLQQISTDGTLDEIDRIWFGEDEELKKIDYSDLRDRNGTIRFAVCTAVGRPFIYMHNGEICGYEADIACRFCKAYGYGLEFVDTEFGEIFTRVSSGDCDMGASCITITEERENSFRFSAPDYNGGMIIVVKQVNASDVLQESKPSVFTSLGNSFRKTFIREERWKMFAGGLGVTVLITVLSAVIGSVLGFALYLLYRKGFRILNVVIDRISEFLQMTPVVVILMIFYYLLFAKAGISGITVSVIAFSLIFACSVKTLLRTAVNAVDIGQTLAVRALGYRDTKGFLRMILPQAVPHFVPGYKGELVALIKGTSVVSYVAVQDLTMVTDIIRSRTYEAFFPLLVTAAIYFLMALLLTRLVDRIEIKSDPCNRKESQILKGVKTDD